MKLYKWIFTAGLVLIAIGLIIYSITDVWNWKSLLWIGIGIVGTVFALIKLDVKSIFKSRRILYGGNMFLMILLVIAILAMVNFFLARHTWRVDTTASGQFSLSNQTVKVLKGLEKDIEVIAFAKDINKGYIEDRMNEYAHYSRHFKWEIIDPDEKPAIAKKYSVKTYGSLVVSCEDMEEQIPNANEESITNAIIKVSREGKKKVYFISGHGEGNIDGEDRDGYSHAKKAIEDQNYEVHDLFLADKDSIPSDASIVVINGPNKELFSHELEMITQFLNNGGSALFMLDPDPGIGLIDYMKNWYIDVGDNLVVDASGMGRFFGAGPDIPLVTNYGDHPIVKEMGSYMTFFPMTRSISPMDMEDASSVNVDELAKTSAQSFGVGDVEEVYRTGKVSLGPNDMRGPITVACATAMDIGGTGRGRDKARIVTIGDSDFASNAYFSNQANGDFFMNVVSWLIADEDLISIRPKAPETRLVNMTPAQTKTVFWLTVVILPAVAFGIGVLVFVRRR